MIKLPVVVVTEQRFMFHGGHYFAEAVGGRAFWQRYLEVFDSIQVIARVQEVTFLPDTAVRADAPGIDFIPLPNYVGWGGISQIPGLLSLTRKAASSYAAFLLRVPGMVGTLMYSWLRLRRWPYGVEVVGDPYDSLSSRALGRKWGNWIRLLAVAQLKKQCQYAVGAAYVTRETLQKRYPPQGKAFQYSSVELPNHLFENNVTAKFYDFNGRDSEQRLIFVGSLSQRYKGLHDLLVAMSMCQSRGWNLKLTVLGDGHYRQEYEGMAKNLALNNVTFLGYVQQGPAVFEQLRSSDLFVMPSLMEGLPRAMLEAMACGVPCIGTQIGGIPELLEKEDLVLPSDPSGLAKKIMEVLSSPSRMQAMSKRNFERVGEYRTDILRQRRIDFYRYLQDVTLEHSLRQRYDH